MKEVVGNAASDDAVEIMVPNGSERLRYAAVCLCCERADQPMDEDGCGICDACLGLPVPANDDLDGPEFRAPSLHPRLTDRRR